MRAAGLASAAPTAALEECRLLRQPDIQGDRIVFVYAGDLWSVTRAGGLAVRLTSHEGSELFPKLSPDGKAILLRSRRASAMQRYDRFLKVPARGGFEETLPLPTAGYASLSPDGGRIAYVSTSYDNRTWKRYRGGDAPQIWTYDFRRNVSEKITDWPGPNEWPMWHGNTIYYASDRGGRTANLWAYDLDQKTHRQVTKFDEYDVKWPSLGSDAIVLENGGYLYVLDLPGEKLTKLQVLVPDDKPGARAEYRNVSRWITDFDLSPSAKRAVFAARGDLFTVPAEKGDVRLLVGTPGARERDPAWSPDGQWIAYLSDQTGEYEIWVTGSDGRTAPRQVTTGGGTFRFAPRWSPDSKKLAFSDKTYTMWWCDAATGRLTKVDKGEYGEIHDYAWAPDSKWLAYSKANAAGLQQLQLYALGGAVTAVSTGMTEDFSPAFDPAGDYLYFISRRTLRPEFGAFELNFQFSATDKLYAMSLRDTLLSPVPPQSDEETGDAKKDDGPGKADKAGKAGKDEAAKPAEPKPVQIDLAGIATRVAALPVPAARYAGVSAFKGKLVFFSLDPPEPDSDDGGTGTAKLFDLEKREAKTILSGVDAAGALSKDGGKLLYKSGETYGIVDVAEGKKSGDGKLATGQLMTVLDPRQEWMQMFDEAWRLERDFYYDPGMGGLDWKAVGGRYRALVPYVAHRADLNYVLGELQGELSTSHAYVGGGDAPQVPRVDVGLLGADYVLDAASGLYRFETVYRARDWNSDVEAPLGMPGIQVEEGDCLLEVNGRPVRAPDNVFAAFVGTTGKQTRIKVGRSATDPQARTYSVKPIRDEGTLRYTAWVDGNREKVAKATGGRVAYIHVPNTSIQGIQEFSKQYYPQVDRQGIIVDERFNGGGFIPDFFVERLRRTTLAYWSTRDGADNRTPSTAIDGPKCILVNQYAGSGGDAFPHYFRLLGIGPLIGMRTWGGLVGISHSLPLVDGGAITMPDFGMWGPAKGEWAIENHGVDPDIEVENTPSEMVSGHDPQLERAIQWTLDELAKNPPRKPARPAYKVQEGLKR